MANRDLFLYDRILSTERGSNKAHACEGGLAPTLPRLSTKAEVPPMCYWTLV